MPMSLQFQQELFLYLPAIIGKFGTPFIIVSERGARSSLRRLNCAFSDVGLPFREFYAVKAYPEREIAEIVLSEGGGFDCSSIPELRLARLVGAQPEDIMFTSNNTSQEEFREAAMNGGCILNLDGIEFVDQVPAPFPELICFRLNPGTRKTGDEVNTIIGDPVKAKYGVPIENIVDAYRAAMRRGAKRFGLHTMVCSNDRNYRNMVKTVQLLLEVAEELWEKLGIKLEFINMGGGIGIPYRPTDSEFDVEALAREAKVLAAEFEMRLGPDYPLPKFFAESGRYVTGPHGVLVTKVINRYKKYRDYIGVEVAMPGNMRPGVYGSYHGLIIVNPDGSIKDGQLDERMVVGSICENCDALTAEPRLLPNAAVGDIAVSEDCGAHAPAMAFNYNGRTRPQRLLIRENGTVIRTCLAETYQDLIARTQGLGGEEHTLRLG